MVNLILEKEVSLSIAKLDYAFENYMDILMIENEESKLFGITESSNKYTEVIKSFFAKLVEMITDLYNRVKESIEYRLHKYQITSYLEKIKQNKKDYECRDYNVKYLDIVKFDNIFMEFFKKVPSIIRDTFDKEFRSIEEYHSKCDSSKHTLMNEFVEIVEKRRNYKGKTVNIKWMVNVCISDCHNIIQMEDRISKMTNSILRYLENLALHEDDPSKLSNIRAFSSIFASKASWCLNCLHTMWNKNMTEVFKDAPKPPDPDDLGFVDIATI